MEVFDIFEAFQNLFKGRIIIIRFLEDNENKVICFLRFSELKRQEKFIISSQHRYFLASLENGKNHPDKRHVYKIKKISDTKSEEKCLTCEKFDKTKQTNDLPKCEYARSKISPNFTHFLLECLGPEVPYTVLVSLTSKKIVETLEDNKGPSMSLPNNFNQLIYLSD